MQFNYDVFGLRLSVNHNLPCLKPVTKSYINPDVKIFFEVPPQEIQQFISESRELFYVVPGEDDQLHYLEIYKTAHGEYFQFLYSSGMEFVVNKDARFIWCNWNSPSSKNHVILHLIGPILGFILRLKGRVCLHACGIISGKGAFAVTGASGSGKSTLAAAFAGSGLQVITDDIMPLKFHNGSIRAMSGYPRLSLYSDSCQYINGIPENLPRLVEDIDKGFFDLQSQSNMFCNEETELKVIYILEWNSVDKDKPEIISLTPAKAVSLLSANTYRNELLDKNMRKEEFIFLTKLIEFIPVKLLRPVNNLGEMEILTNKILDDYAAINI